MRRGFLLCLGWLFFALAVIGVALPLVPTTPFLLLAAYFFSQSSDRVHQMLMNNAYFGPVISDWHTNHIIRLKTKWIASVLMLIMISYPLIYMINNYWVRGLVISIILAVLGFIWSKPSAI
ncbi:DUF454 family protein [Glaciecola sp. XM2]|uniref:YbaN family protein n=1 Tax=Glaciecola sp. XM2 TaxID=1914931 RepID=UPI001BDE17EC|nr:DUF454 family protein [Glaciecola sp. XM2]